MQAALLLAQVLTPDVMQPLTVAGGVALLSVHGHLAVLGWRLKRHASLPAHLAHPEKER